MKTKEQAFGPSRQKNIETLGIFICRLIGKVLRLGIGPLYLVKNGFHSWSVSPSTFEVSSTQGYHINTVRSLLLTVRLSSGGTKTSVTASGMLKPSFLWVLGKASLDTAETEGSPPSSEAVSGEVVPLR